MDDAEQFIDFGVGESVAAKVSGWSFQEEGFTWTIGPAAVISLPPRPAGQAARFMMAAYPLLHAGLARQRLRVSIAGQAVADLEIGEETVVRLEVPASLASGEGPVILTLHLPDAVSPTSQGLGNDDRLLALAVKWVRWGASGGAAGAGAGRKTIVLVRHQQTAALATIFNRLPLLQDRYAVIACAPVLARVRDATLGVIEGQLAAIWVQQGHGAPTAAEVRALAPPETPVLTYPMLSMEPLWPFAGHDPRLVAEPPLYPRGRYHHPDSVAAELAGEGAKDDDSLFAAYLERSAGRTPDLPSALGDYAQELVRRDASCDVKLASFILAQFQEVQLFHNREGPAGALLRYLAIQLLMESRLFTPERLGPLLLELDRLLGGYLGAWHDQAPVHPAVAVGYRLRWSRPDQLYRWYENEWGFRDYILNYIRWAPWTV